jgi:molecular chaperone GrpE
MAERKKRHAEAHAPAEPEMVEEPQAVEKPAAQTDDIEKLKAELSEANDKYLRLYAEMENYRKKVRKDREEYLAYCNEDLLYELLPVMDNLEMALVHSAKSSEEAQGSLRQGVENTLREFNRTLEKFGLKAIGAVGQPFDPAYHHAMSQIERPDVQPGNVAEEMRRGYLYKEKVLRPSLVAVSKKTEEDNT